MNHVGAEPVLSDVEGCPHLPGRAQPGGSSDQVTARPNEDIWAYATVVLQK
jgi:hypothetical protein